MGPDDENGLYISRRSSEMLLTVSRSMQILLLMAYFFYVNIIKDFISFCILCGPYFVPC